MSKTAQMMIGAALVAMFAAPIDARAAAPRSVSCSVSVDYLLDDVVRAPYQKDFVVTSGVPFQDDFSTATRFRFFEASVRPDADNKTMIVSISYFNDVGVFESVELATELRLRDDKAPESTAGTHAYWSSLGVAGNHTTRYLLTCQVVKN